MPKFYTDEGISGTKSSRPALDRMMEATDADAEKELEKLAANFPEIRPTTSHENQD